MTQVEAQKLLPRNEIPVEMKWRLEDIFPSNSAFEEEYRRVSDMMPGIEAYRGKVGESAHTLLEVTRLSDDILERVSRLYGYAHMRKDEDNTNPVYQSLFDRVQALYVRAGSIMSFVVPEITALPDGTIDRFYSEEPALQVYRHHFDDILRSKRHTLSPAEERLLAMAGELTHNPRNTFMMLNNADIKFPAIRDESGNEVELTKGRYIQFLESRDRRVRREAFEALYGTYHKQRNTLASLITGAVKSNIFYARARNYPSAQVAALDGDNIPVSVYDNLIQVIREFNPLMHRYVRLRRKMLGLSEIHMHDLFTPMVKEVDLQVPYDEARQTVLKAMAPLGEKYQRILDEGLHNGWIDVLENVGKTSGAYSSSAYPVHPYVLLNYQCNVDNMFTLAHEMGHALHTYHTFKNQPFAYSDYSLFTAEVASTLNESLLNDYLLKKATDRNERMYLLNHHLEQFRGTVFRQTMFAEFEKIIHARVEQGEALTPDTLSEIYHGLNVDYYGPDMVVDPEIAMEWGRIPHFYLVFYVYKYATGFSAATALSQQILSEGQPAVERYIRFLSSGGSDYPIELLKKAGVDMTSPEPIRSALKVFERILDEMESLA